MLRKQIVQKHVNYQEITHVIGHSWSIYVMPLLKMVLFLGCLYVIYLLLARYFPVTETMRWVFGFLGIFFYAKGMIDFLNLYLDCMVLTPMGIVVFKREGLLEYQTDTFDRERIETVSHTQDSLRDKMLQKGDVLVTLEHGVTYGFNNVHAPMKYANVITTQKYHYLGHHEDETEDHNDKFELLVETLGEVIHEYMGKGKKDIPVSPRAEDYDGYDY